MEQLVIRKANEKDRNQIANAISVCYEKEFSSLVKDMNRVASALASGIQIPRFYVAELNGETVGITACTDCSGRALYINKKSFNKEFGLIKGAISFRFMNSEFTHSLPYPKDTGFIEFVGVLPKYQGRSVAKKIINYIIETTEYRSFILDVTDINIPAQKCYNKIGFIEYQRVPERWGKFKGFKERIFMKYEK